MKQLTNLFILVLCVTFLYSCGGDPKAKLTGKWKIADIQSSDMDMSKMSEDEKKEVEKLMKEMKEKSSFEFMADGKYEMKMFIMGNEQKESGTWEVDKEGKTLTTKGGDGKETKMDIEELSASKLVIKDKEGKNKMTLEK